MKLNLLLISGIIVMSFNKNEAVLNHNNLSHMNKNEMKKDSYFNNFSHFAESLFTSKFLK